MSKVIFAALLSLPMIVVAEGRHFSTTDGVGIIQYSNGPDVYVKLSTPLPKSVLDCARGGNFVRWELNSGTGKEFYSTALAAYMAGKQLELYFNSGATCHNGYPQPTSLGVAN